ncbi:DUF5693 family protein [Acetivibrio clariflavus]|uniref:DUF5693 family protein n=1 Tax=Acetivibrio clariflavus TaxID=288965 RepID=UPI0031F4920B
MRKALWTLLIISIILLMPVIYLRVSNEIRNNSVILACNYQEFMPKNENFDPIDLRILKEYGISAVIVKRNFDSTNTKLFEEIQNYGLKIILNLDSLNHSDDYYKELEYAVKKYNIRYLLVYNPKEENHNTDLEQNTNIEKLTALIDRNNLIFFVMENRDQTGYMPVQGLESLIVGTNYSLNRAFTVSHHNSKISSGKDAAMMWLRAVVDRNIRLVCIEPFSLSKNDETNNYTLEILRTAKSLSKLLVEKGYSVDKPIEKVNTKIPNKYYNIPIIINIAAAMALFLDYSGVKRKWIYIFSVAVTVLSALLIFGFIKPDNNIWSAFAASVVYPSLSNAVLLKGMERPNTRFVSLVVTSLLKILAVNGMGVCVVIASMGDIRYTMGLIDFDPVIAAFIIPFLMFYINFLFVSQGQGPLYKKIINRAKSIGVKRYIISNLIYVFLCSVVICIYLLRTGNFNVLPQFSAELRMREFLELIFPARPRTKEFAIAYPSLFAFLYLYKKDGNYKLLSFLGSLSSIIGISVINSFCHGFTPVLTSLNRTFSGLLLGIITGLVSLAVCWFLCKIFKK